jgi:hypothetical protein
MMVEVFGLAGVFGSAVQCACTACNFKKMYHFRTIISFLTRTVMGSIPCYSKVSGEKKNKMLFSAANTIIQ